MPTIDDSHNTSDMGSLFLRHRHNVGHFNYLPVNLLCLSVVPSPSRGRLKHGRHFTYKSFTGEQAITLVCCGVQGAFTDEEHPLAAQGPWLQVFIGNNFIGQFLDDLDKLLQQVKVGNGIQIVDSAHPMSSLSFLQSLPYKLEWSDQRLAITITPNE